MNYIIFRIDMIDIFTQTHTHLLLLFIISVQKYFNRKLFSF